MRRSSFTDAQTIAALKEHAAGRPAKELCRRVGLGVGDAVTLLAHVRWHGGDRGAAVARTEDDNRRLKRIVADPGSDIAELRDVLSG